MTRRRLLRGIAGRVRAVSSAVQTWRDLRRNLAFGSPTTSTRQITSPAPDRGVEIVVPCFNHAAFLEEAVQSVLAQTWREHEVVLTFIDDASTDSTREVIAALVEDDGDGWISYRTLRNETTLRQWASINRAVASSDAALFVVLNDDDVLVPDCLEKIVATYQRRPQIALLGATSIWFESGRPRPAHVPRPIDALHLTVYTPHDARRYRRLRDLNMTHSSSSFRRSAWEAVGGYRPPERRVARRANEDRDFQIRVNTLFDVGVYRDYPLAWWRSDSSHGGQF